MADTAPAGSIKAGGAYVELFTVDSKLHKGLAAAQQSLNKFSQAALKTGAALTAAGGAIVAGLLANAKAFAEAGDALDKMSQRTGIAVESLSALKYAAGQSGTSIEQIEDAIKDMSKNLVDAQAGSQGLVDTLNQLGLSASSMGGMGAEKQFLAITDALSKVPDVGKRATLAMSLFGEGGRQLLPMLAGGSAGIEAMMAKAKELGLVMSEEDAKAAAKLQDEIGKLSGAFEALKNTVGAAVAKDLTDFLNYLNEAAPAIQKAIGNNKEWISWIGETSIKLGAVGLAMGAAGTAAYALSTAITVLKTATVGLTASLAIIAGVGVVAGLALIADEIIKQVTAQREWNREMERSIDLREKLSQVGEKQTGKVIEESKKHGGSDRTEFLQTEIDREQKNLEAKQKRVKELEAEAQRHEATAAAMSEDGAGRGIYERKAQHVRQGEMADEQAILDQTQRRLDALKAEMESHQTEQQTMDRSANSSQFGMSQSNLTHDPANSANADQFGFTIFDGIQEQVERDRKEAAKIKATLEQEAEEVAEAMMTPAEKLQKRLAHLETLKEHGLSEENYQRAVTQAKLEANAGGTKGKLTQLDQRTTNAAAVQKGSQEAFSAIAAAMQGRDKIETQIEKNTKATANSVKQMAKFKQGVTVKEFNITA